MSQNCRKEHVTRGSLMIAALFAILLAQHSYAQSPNPQPSPVDVDKLCADARKQDENNKGNPMYQQSDVSEQCAAAHAAKVAGDGASIEGTARLIPATVCTTTMVMCLIGDGWPPAKPAAEALQPVCAGTSLGVSAFEKIKEGDVAGDLMNDIKGKNYVGASMQVIDIASDIKDLASIAGSSTPKTSSKCWGSVIAAVTEIGQVTMHYMTASQMSDAERDIKKGIAQIASAGSVPDMSNFKDIKDKDGEALPKDELKFDPQLEAQLESLTGMTSSDFMKSQGDPEAILEKILANMNAPPEVQKNAKEMYRKIVGDKAAIIASRGRLSNDYDSLGSPGYSGGEGFEGGRGLAGARKLGAANSKLFKDPSKMTPEELEQDKYHDIFLRVTRRYEATAPKELELLPWALKANQFANAKGKNGRTPGSDKLRFTQ